DASCIYSGPPPLLFLRRDPLSRRGGKTRSLNWYPDGFTDFAGWNRDGSRVQEQVAPEGGDESVPSSSSAMPKGHCLVDCFGLGPVSYSDLRARKLQSWGPLLDGYLSERRCLTTVLHLVSSEYFGGLEDADRDLVEIFKRALATRRRKGIEPFEYIQVLTKADLLLPEDLPGCLERLGLELGRLGLPPRGVVACSVDAEGGPAPVQCLGAEELRGVIEAAAGRGWSRQPSWEGERKVRDIPRRNRDEAKQVREALFRSRVIDLNDERQTKHRGGKGATTIMPSSV
ncbi:unnamed protein product, partial [Prorocentrum cordatum]